MYRKLIVALLLCTSPAAFGQGIYSWKDAQGQTHYSDLPPPDAKVRTLRQAPLTGSKPATSTDDSAAPATPSYAEQELAFRKRRAEAAEAEEKARKEKSNDEARQRDCADARAQLTALESGQRMTRFNENGERVFMDDDERSAAIERSRAAVERSCR